MSSKRALLIANSRTASALPPLRAATGDVAALAKILSDAEIGSFDEVTPLLDATSTQIRREVARFLGKRVHDDLLLLYFTCHGVLDEGGSLYLAVADTELDFLSATAIPAAFVTSEMDRCQSRRQVLMLDCCYSGAFERGAKGAALTVPATTFEGNGIGRIVLTASDSTELSWEPVASAEGPDAATPGPMSLFTRHLIAGLETGEADLDSDGLVTVDELYDYVYKRVVTENPRQTPGKWSYRQQGDLVIARHRGWRRPVPQLPAELTSALDHPLARVREGAVRELAHFLRGHDPLLAEAARTAAERAMEDDSRRVAAAAADVLAEVAPAAAPPSPPSRPDEPVHAPVNQETPEPAAKPEASTILEGYWPLLLLGGGVLLMFLLLFFNRKHPEEQTEETTPATTAVTEPVASDTALSTAAPVSPLLAEGQSWPVAFAGDFTSIDAVKKVWTVPDSLNNKNYSMSVPTSGHLRLGHSDTGPANTIWASDISGDSYVTAEMWAVRTDLEGANCGFAIRHTEGIGDDTVLLTSRDYERWQWNIPKNEFKLILGLSPAALHPLAETNTFAVVVKGIEVVVFINGIEVDHFETIFHGGGTGIRAANGECDFAKFEIRTPPRHKI